MEKLIQMHKLGYFYNRASCKWLRVFKIHFWGFNTWRLKISPLLHGLWCERRTTLSVLLDHWQEWVHTFHLPCDSTVMHFKGSVADFLVVLVQASAWFVKCGVSCLLCCWNQRGNTESICLWRKGTAVVHRREIRSKKYRLPLAPFPLRPRKQAFKQPWVLGSCTLQVELTLLRGAFLAMWWTQMFWKQTIPTEFSKTLSGLELLLCSN